MRWALWAAADSMVCRGQPGKGPMQFMLYQRKIVTYSMPNPSIAVSTKSSRSPQGPLRSPVMQTLVICKQEHKVSIPVIPPAP